jgi:hypothetical protein
MVQVYSIKAAATIHQGDVHDKSKFCAGRAFYLCALVGAYLLVRLARCPVYLGRLLDGKASRLGAFEDTVKVERSLGRAEPCGT